jgi:hypothetical protein
VAVAAVRVAVAAPVAPGALVGVRVGIAVAVRVGVTVAVKMTPPSQGTSTGRSAAGNYFEDDTGMLSDAGQFCALQ